MQRFRGVRELKSFYWLLLTVYCLLFTACQSQAIAGAVVSNVGATAVVTPTLLKPPEITAVEAAAPDATISSDAPATPTTIPTLAPTDTPSPTPLVTNTPTATPTATPPHLPNTLATDHYWLRRPVAEDGVVWTDKFYPYGGTRGGILRPHHGVEFNVPYDTPILAAASGTVVVAGNDHLVVWGPETDFYGNLVIIELDSRLEDDQPVYNLYAHLNEVLVQPGQHVGAQQTIGLSGATGVADGAHMHFEVRVGSNSYDTTRNPLLWLYPFPDRGTVVGRVVGMDGSLAKGVEVQLRPLNGGANTAVTTTYASDSVNSDPNWDENFVIDDVYAGSYEVVIEIGEEKFTETVDVQIYRTSFVEVTIVAEETEIEE